MMINVIYNGGFSLTVNGHSGQAQRGEDIVCAGASALLYALAETLESHRDGCERLKIDLVSGFGYIEAIPTPKYKNAALNAFETVLNGYAHLADAYPEYLRLDKI